MVSSIVIFNLNLRKIPSFCVVGGAGGEGNYKCVGAGLLKEAWYTLGWWLVSKWPEKEKHSEGNMFRCYFSTANPTQNFLGLNSTPVVKSRRRIASATAGMTLLNI
jgi:hypothetical protein